MSIERVREYFRKLGIEDRVMEIDESSATVALAAKALGCEEGRIAKTISFSLDGEPILIVTAGDTKIDNAKYKSRFGKKAKMLSHEEAAQLIGHAVGGVCPFAVNDGVKIYLDESLKRFNTVYPACGSSNSMIELTPAELEEYSKPESWVDVCKPMAYKSGRRRKIFPNRLRTLDKPQKKSYNHIANKWGRSSAGRAYGSHP